MLRQLLRAPCQAAGSAASAALAVLAVLEALASRWGLGGFGGSRTVTRLRVSCARATMATWRRSGRAGALIAKFKYLAETNT
jgi:hypothetical protein